MNHVKVYESQSGFVAPWQKLLEEMVKSPGHNSIYTLKHLLHHVEH